MRVICKLIFSLFIISFLIGCTTAPKHISKDGKKPGTQRPYKVKGKWYTPLSSSKGYVKRGIASWYGRDFHGRKTSNGEVYNMYSMTAAHKTLPLDTYVKVTRLDNNKSVTVRINDRGPFVRGRIIDLSYKAANKLDMADEGTSKVVIEALGKKVGDTYVVRDYNRGSFTLQVGAFKVKSNALRLKERLNRTHGSTTIQKYNTYSETFYRVRVGNYSELVEAERARNSFEKMGFKSPFVVAEE
ncbi:MAG: septal ring lytic transglycosylase RlpA family protein [Thermodesulfobacteriota bacterium]